MFPFIFSPSRALLLFSLLVVLPRTLLSQEESPGIYEVDTIDTSADIFDDREPMHVTLTFDIKKYQREKYRGEYMPVQFLYEFNDSIFLEKEMRLKARGNFRRSYCSRYPS